MSSYRNWSALTWLFLLAAIAGAVIPWYFNLRQALYGTEPITVGAYFAHGMMDNFTASITTDFLIAATPLFAWMIVEHRRRKMKMLFGYIAITFLISFACSISLFMFNRERLRTNDGKM